MIHPLRHSPITIIFGLAIASCTSISLKPSQPRAAKLNESYHERLEIIGANTPICNVTVIAGTPPPGVSVSHKNLERTIELFGKPTQAGEYTFKLDVSACGTNFPGASGTFTQQLKVSN